MPNNDQNISGSSVPVIPSEDIIGPVIPQVSSGSSAPTDDIPTPNSPSMPPTKFKKNYPGGKIIATILGLVVLVGGLSAGIYLVREQQQISEKAYSNVTTPPTDTCNFIQVTAVDAPNCPRISGSQVNNVSSYTGTYALKNITSSVHEVAIKKSSNFCTEPFGQIDPNLPNWPVCYSSDMATTEFITIQPNETKTVTINRTSDRGVACGSYQTDLYITSIDGNASCHGSDNNGLIAASLCQTGIQCPGDTTATAQCQNIKAYSESWTLLSPSNLSALKTGNKVNFCASGVATSGSFDKAKFTINNVIRTETTTVRPNSTDFCDQYTIPSGTTSFKVTAQLHHVTLGWK